MPYRKPMMLRLSVTERCNLRCRYCAPAEGFPKTPYRLLPSLDRLVDTAAWLAARWNVTRIKVTGGEPLVRPEVARAVGRLTQISGVDEVSLTTNGSYLRELATKLKEAGLRRVNVSLDTLDEARFRDLCGGSLADTLEGIDAALAAGLTPLKLNTVLHSSSWRKDVPSLLDYAAEKGLELRFIELMKLGTSQSWARQEYVPATAIREWLQRESEVEFLKHDVTKPARLTRVKWGDREVIVGWITPETESFCHGCDRLRLDCHGRLRRCLMDTAQLPLTEILENEGSEAAEHAVTQFLAGKHAPEFMNVLHPMIALGG